MLVRAFRGGSVQANERVMVDQMVAYNPFLMAGIGVGGCGRFEIIVEMY